MIQSTAKSVIYISEAEAASDFAALLARVRAGTEVIIEHDDQPIAIVQHLNGVIDIYRYLSRNELGQNYECCSRMPGSGRTLHAFGTRLNLWRFGNGSAINSSRRAQNLLRALCEAVAGRSNIGGRDLFKFYASH